jgi:hypothetical protein
MRKYVLLAALLSQATIAQVNLGGVSVPRDKFVVFLFIGHSNMAGRDINHSDNVPNPRAWNYQWMSDKRWVLAKEEPGNLKNGLSGRGCGGGGMPNLKALAQAFPAYHIGAIDNASLSGTSHGSVANNSSGMPGDSNRYWKGSQLYNEITAAAKEVRKTATLGGIFCMLGTIEATRTSEEVCRNFSKDIAQMATDMREEIGEPNLPFLMGEYEAGATGTYDPAKPWPKIIAAQIDSVPAKLPFSALVESQGLEMLDDHHYTATALGHGEWAKRALAVIQAKGWFPGTVSIMARGPRPAPGKPYLAGVVGDAGPALILYAIPQAGRTDIFANGLGRISRP